MITTRRTCRQREVVCPHMAAIMQATIIAYNNSVRQRGYALATIQPIVCLCVSLRFAICFVSALTMQINAYTATTAKMANKWLVYMSV